MRSGDRRGSGSGSGAPRWGDDGGEGDAENADQRPAAREGEEFWARQNAVSVSPPPPRHCERCEGLERALKHAQARAVAAVRQAAKLKVELDHKFEEDAAFKEKLGSIENRQNARQSEAAETKEKLREAEYKIECLKKEVQRKSEALRDAKYRANARLERFATSLEATEEAALERGERLLEATRAIQQTVLDLRRHLGTRGFHAVNSYTAKRLMAKICDASNKLGRAAILPGQKRGDAGLLVIGDEAKARDSTDSTSSSDEEQNGEEEIDRALLMDSILYDGGGSPTAHMGSGKRARGRIGSVRSKASQAALLMAAKDGSLLTRSVGARAGSDPASAEHHKLVRDLCKLCQDLERRNGQLATKLEGAQLEAEAAQARSSASALVPKYRLAIVRAKAQAHAMHEKLQRQNEHLASLEDQVTSQQTHLGEMSRQRDQEQLRRQQSETKATKLEQENSRLRARLRDLDVREERRRQLLDGLQRERGLYSDEAAAYARPATSLGLAGDLGAPSGSPSPYTTGLEGRDFPSDRELFEDNGGGGLDEVLHGFWRAERPASAPHTPDLSQQTRLEHPLRHEEHGWPDPTETASAVGADLFGRRSVYTPDTVGSASRFMNEERRSVGTAGLGAAAGIDESAVGRELASTLRENLDSLHREIASLQQSMV